MVSTCIQGIQVVCCCTDHAMQPTGQPLGVFVLTRFVTALSCARASLYRGGWRLYRRLFLLACAGVSAPCMQDKYRAGRAGRSHACSLGAGHAGGAVAGIDQDELLAGEARLYIHPALWQPRVRRVVFLHASTVTAVQETRRVRIAGKLLLCASRPSTGAKATCHLTRRSSWWSWASFGCVCAGHTAVHQTCRMLCACMCCVLCVLRCCGLLY